MSTTCKLMFHKSDGTNVLPRTVSGTSIPQASATMIDGTLRLTTASNTVKFNLPADIIAASVKVEDTVIARRTSLAELPAIVTPDGTLFPSIADEDRTRKGEKFTVRVLFWSAATETVKAEVTVADDDFADEFGDDDDD